MSLDPDAIQEKALEALAKGQHRLAQLMLEDLLAQGRNPELVSVNYGLSLLYQFRWWEGALILFRYLAALPEGPRRQSLSRLSQGLKGYARQLRAQQLEGDARDCLALVDALRPWPGRVLALAVRWLPRLSKANRQRVLLDFGLWLRAQEPDPELSDAELRVLFELAAKEPNREFLLGLFLQGLLSAVTGREGELPAWVEAATSWTQMRSDPATWFALAAQDLLSQGSQGRLQGPFLTHAARFLLLGDRPYRLPAWKAWLEAAESAWPERVDDPWRLDRVFDLAQLYQIGPARQGWAEVWERLQGLDPDSLDWRQAAAYQARAVFALPYFSASLADRSWLQGRISRRYEEAIGERARERGWSPLTPDLGGPLRIGYLSHTVRRHPVGFLLGALVARHDPEIEVYVYDTAPAPVQDDLSAKIAARVKALRLLPLGGDLASARKAAEVIAHDRIQILVDLDGSSCAAHVPLLWFRPAPRILTWFGADAHGVSCVDGFLADPWVLPQAAQAHYHERILRLPASTWIPPAYGPPPDEAARQALRRALGIARDAVVCVVSAPGIKIDPGMAEAVVEILARTTKAILLVKGRTHLPAMEAYWRGLLKARGLAWERFRFLPYAPTREAHHGHLALADVLLDTWPWNAGSHGFESLWQGTPVVTRHGETFCSRMGLSMAHTQGIAQYTTASDLPDYIDRAVTLLEDDALRASLREGLRQRAAEGSGLWNSRSLMADYEALLRGEWGRAGG